MRACCRVPIGSCWRCRRKASRPGLRLEWLAILCFSRPEAPTANLLGPLVIRRDVCLGVQSIREDARYSSRQPLFVAGAARMLVIRRRQGEGFLIGDSIEVDILEIDGNQVKIGIRAPRETSILRKEIAATRDTNLASGPGCGSRHRGRYAEAAALSQAPISQAVAD